LACPWKLLFQVHLAAGRRGGATHPRKLIGCIVDYIRLHSTNGVMRTTLNNIFVLLPSKYMGLLSSLWLWL
jgi:hypothetical protein